MSSVDLSYYDVLEADIIPESVDGQLPTTGNWQRLALAYQRVKFGIGEQRINHYGNSQTLSIDKRVKKWGLYELDLLALKYSSNPLWDWWTIVKNAFYGSAVEPASPALRPGTASIGAKLNYATPEYWTLRGCKHTQFQLMGNMTQGELKMKISGMSKFATLDTTDYIQGSAARLNAPAKDPIIPASDITILLDGTDRSTEIEDFTLTLSRAYKQAGRDSSDGSAFREFVPNTFEGRLELKQEPLRSEHMTKYLSDTGITCEIRAQNSTNGKKIQFTAAKHRKGDQEHQEQVSPSMLSLDIVGSTFLVSTV